MGPGQAAVIALAATALVLAPPGPAPTYVPAETMRAPAVKCEGPPYPPFPPRAISAFEAKWFSEQLSAAEEPVFRSRPLERLRARYRVTLVPSFTSTVTVRVEEHANGSFSLEAKYLSGRGGYDPGHAAHRVARSLTVEEAGSLRALLARADVRALNNDRCVGVLGADGTEWLFEAVEPGGRQRFVRIWEPQGGAMRTLGETFRRLAGPEFVHPPPGGPLKGAPFAPHLPPPLTPP